jgi:hypothetical protein
MLKQIKWGGLSYWLSILRWDAWNGLETLGFHTDGRKWYYASSSFSE